MNTPKKLPLTAPLRTCDFCNSEEGKIRRVGRFIVSLSPVKINGDEKLACQSCARKVISYRNQPQTNKSNEDKDLFNLKKILSLVLHSFILVLALCTITYAQPGLPGAPSQAPIDGGLGLLAAAGGAYALRKLREKNKMPEE